MVPPEIIREIKQCYDALAQHSLDPHSYTEPVFQVVFEIITADTFIAGIASKILDGDPVEPEDRVILSNPLLIGGHWWRCDNGQVFDVRKHEEVRRIAVNIERLRKKCNEALTSTTRW